MIKKMGMIGFFFTCVVGIYWQRDSLFHHETKVSDAESYVVSQVREGQTFGQPLVGGAFELVDQNGKIRTDRDFRGRWTLVYFGYTFCPDVCPMALENMEKALRLLGEKAKKIQVVFITVDPERDTSHVLKEFLSNYDSSIVGLTGSHDQVESAKAVYRVHASRVEHSDVKNYLIDHSSLIYIMSPRGQYIDSMNHETAPALMAEALKKVL